MIRRERWGRLRPLLTGVLLLCAAVVGVHAGGDWRPLASSESPGLEWMSIEGARIAAGDGSRVRLGSLTPLPLWERSVQLKQAAPAVDGMLVRDRLYVTNADGRLYAVELTAVAATNHHGHGAHDATGAETTALDAGTVREIPFPRTAPRRLARAGDLLVLAEDGFGLRLLALPDHHAPATALPVEIGRIPLVVSFTAITAFGNTVVAASADGALFVADVDPANPRTSRTLTVPGSVSALALQGDRLAIGGPAGVRTVNLALPGDGVEISQRPVSALHLAGRRLIGLGGGGIESWRDVSPAAALVPVTVSNNFFSPSSIDVDAGDTVRWTLSFGFHNVFSCIVGQSGCTVAANETFNNGPPSDGPWVFNHTFAQGGSNPYVCQSHAPSMTGMVNVVAGVLPPPEVPDGSIGTPMTVGKDDPSAKGLQIDWDGTTCPGAVGYAILWGSAASWPALPGGTYQPAGSVCALSSDSYLWNPSPDAASQPGGLVWWLVVSNDNDGTEGSWGRDSFGSERSGSGAAGASGACGATIKSLDAICP